MKEYPLPFTNFFNSDVLFPDLSIFQADKVKHNQKLSIMNYSEEVYFHETESFLDNLIREETFFLGFNEDVALLVNEEAVTDVHKPVMNIPAAKLSSHSCDQNGSSNTLHPTSSQLPNFDIVPASLKGSDLEPLTVAEKKTFFTPNIDCKSEAMQKTPLYIKDIYKTAFLETATNLDHSYCAAQQSESKCLKPSAEVVNGVCNIPSVLKPIEKRARTLFKRPSIGTNINVAKETLEVVGELRKFMCRICHTFPRPGSYNRSVIIFSRPGRCQGLLYKQPCH